MSRFALAAGFLAIAVGASALPGAGRAAAGTIVLRADGSGDVPSFQAGVDELMRAESGADLLVVEPGHYDEDVVFDFSSGFCWGAIVCPEGPESTSVRSLTASGDASLSRCEVRGLEVHEKVALGGSTRAFSWQGCRFLSDVESLGHHQQWFEACEFRGPLRMSGGGHVEDSRFVGTRASLQLTFGVLRVHRSAFEFSADTAVFITPGDNSRIEFESCRFRSVASGIVVNPDGFYGDGEGLTVRDCVFQDVLKAAITYQSSLSNSGWFDLEVAHSRFERCGRGVELLSGGRVELALLADTLLETEGNGIEGKAMLTGRLDSLVVRNGKANGIVLSWPSLAVSPLALRHSVIEGNAGDGVVVEGAPIESSAGLAVRECVIARNGGAGLRARGILAITGNLVAENAGAGLSLLLAEADGDSVVRNTLFANGGDGLMLAAAPEMTAPRLWVENNLAAENRGRGLVVDPVFSGALRHNDAWRNLQGDLVGIHLGQNLSVDPLFCDAPKGDLHVAANSPCGPLGPYGEIGAFGVGCEAEPVAGGSGGVLLAVSRIAPNPASSGREVTVAFSLPAARPTSLELLDATGRRFVRRDLGAPDAGDHRLQLSLGRDVPPGMYWVRLTQDGRWASSKVSVLP